MTTPPPGPQPWMPYPPPRATNTMAVLSLVCAFVFAPLGIVFGHVSLSQIKRTGEDGHGLAVAGLVIGYLVTLFSIVVVVVGLLFLGWTAHIAERSPAVPTTESPGTPPAGRTLPAFHPPVGLGADCRYPADGEAVGRPVTPPRAGRVPTTPAEVDAVMSTDHGELGLRLDNAKAPCTVNSFVSLAQQGFFDGTPCHRLTTAPDLSVLQCGDPTGLGTGGPGYRFDDEYPTNQFGDSDPALRLSVSYPRGTLAMANAGPDTNGSQFFIVYRASQLPPGYTVFGAVDEGGLRVLDAIARAGTKDGGEDGEPRDPVTVSSIRLR